MCLGCLFQEIPGVFGNWQGEKVGVRSSKVWEIVGKSRTFFFFFCGWFVDTRKINMFFC